MQRGEEEEIASPSKLTLNTISHPQSARSRSPHFAARTLSATATLAIGKGGAIPAEAPFQAVRTVPAGGVTTECHECGQDPCFASSPAATRSRWVSEQGGEGHRQHRCRHDHDVDRVSQPLRRRVRLLRRRMVPHGRIPSPRAPRHFRRRPLLDRSAQVIGLGLVQEPSPLLHELPRHRRRRAPEVDSVRLELERHSAPP